MTLVYLDTETTGLDPDRHQIWEIAYAVDDGPILSSIVGHHLLEADPTALEVNGYHDRGRLLTASEEILAARFMADLYEALKGATLVGANPAFDAAFLRKRWNGKTPWRYRMLDVEAYAMPALKLDTPKGLAYIADYLGFQQQPDHTAAMDVRVLRNSHQALSQYYRDSL